MDFPFSSTFAKIKAKSQRKKLRCRILLCFPRMFLNFYSTENSGKLRKKTERSNVKIFKLHKVRREQKEKCAKFFRLAEIGSWLGKTVKMENWLREQWAKTIPFLFGANFLSHDCGKNPNFAFCVRGWMFVISWVFLAFDFGLVWEFSHILVDLKCWNSLSCVHNLSPPNNFYVFFFQK